MVGVGSKLSVEKRWEEEDGWMETWIALKLFKRPKEKALVGDSGRELASVMEAIMISLGMENGVMVLVRWELKEEVVMVHIMVEPLMCWVWAFMKPCVGLHGPILRIFPPENRSSYFTLHGSKGSVVGS
jgi:hypothetical protein